MKAFLRKISIYLSPVFIYFLVIYIADPLKCFRTYPEYYKSSFVSYNRENVCLALFEQVPNNVQINSFILGNSCSHAYKTNEWLRHLPPGSRAFHLDAYRETLDGIEKKLEYLQHRGNAIKNVIIIIDRSVFSSKFKSYMYVMPKRLNHSNQFYVEHLKILTSLKFVASYCYYYFFHNNLSFMKEYGFIDSHQTSNNQTGDLNYNQDEELAADSVNIYNKLKQQDWIKRENVTNLIGNNSFEGLNARNIQCLQTIKKILDANKTNYKIVINPLYDQKALPNNELQILLNVFGAKNVFNFSGANIYTNDFKNFYDGVHYRPSLANKVMDSVYKSNAL